MSSIVVPLSLGNIKQLQRQLKQLSRDLDDRVKVDMEQATCAALALQIRSDIASIADVDGNYLGSDNPNASVFVRVGLPGHDVIWQGAQIAYLEFGTGRAGVGYPGVAMAQAGYSPDPRKASWTYPDERADKGWAVSTGLKWQGPMYNTSVMMRLGDPYLAAKVILRTAVRSAVTV